jgi:hypothetical protein
MTLLAYLDAGSGSVLIQAVVGGFAAVAVVLKLFWRRILNVLGIRKPESGAEPERAHVSTAEPAEHDSPVAGPTR